MELVFGGFQLPLLNQFFDTLRVVTLFFSKAVRIATMIINL